MMFKDQKIIHRKIAEKFVQTVRYSCSLPWRLLKLCLQHLRKYSLPMQISTSFITCTLLNSVYKGPEIWLKISILRLFQFRFYKVISALATTVAGKKMKSLSIFMSALCICFVLLSCFQVDSIEGAPIHHPSPILPILTAGLMVKFLQTP